MGKIEKPTKNGHKHSLALCDALHVKQKMNKGSFDIHRLRHESIIYSVPQRAPEDIEGEYRMQITCLSVKLRNASVDIVKGNFKGFFCLSYRNIFMRKYQFSRGNFKKLEETNLLLLKMLSKSDPFSKNFVHSFMIKIIVKQINFHMYAKLAKQS